MSTIIQTIIAPSIHRAKQLERLNANPLARSLTLENFIQAYYERYGNERIVGMGEVTSIVAFLFMAQERVHFNYITLEGEAMEQIAAFILDMKRNGVVVDAFGFVESKARELRVLADGYNDFLKKQHLSDNADRDRFTLESIRKNPETLTVFGEIIVDDFEQNGINFGASKTQSALLDALRSSGISMSREIVESVDPIFHEPSPAPFGIFDEVACALKIARRLLDEKVKPDDILIVTPAIDEYAPIFETLFTSYGLKGYTSMGTSLNALIPMLKNSDDKNELLSLARNRQNQIKVEIEKISKTLSALGIPYDSTKGYEKAIKSARIKSRSNEGILITEPNQLLSLDHVGHLIFVGTDMGHFPPVSKEGFLASTLQKETLLYGNSVYLSSYNHYQQMRAISDNFYIVTATYKGKT